MFWGDFLLNAFSWMNFIHYHNTEFHIYFSVSISGGNSLFINTLRRFTSNADRWLIDWRKIPIKRKKIVLIRVFNYNVLKNALCKNPGVTLARKISIRSTQTFFELAIKETFLYFVCPKPKRGWLSAWCHSTKGPSWGSGLLPKIVKICLIMFCKICLLSRKRDQIDNFELLILFHPGPSWVCICFFFLNFVEIAI